MNEEKKEVKVCECEQPVQPIGGEACEICGKFVPPERRLLPPLGVSVQETIKTKDVNA